ncbi:MAG: AAA family ATPase, partial [Acidobacteria bacterium]|nr:AAA family ATPase [Acidobacteriota bacterium]
MISKKGGVGKTTSAVNLAAAFAERGRRTLVVDLDPQASASLSLGLRRGDLIPSAADLLLRRKRLGEVVRATSVPGLDLVTASIDLASLESELGFQSSEEMRLAGLLRGPQLSGYDLVFIDCPPSFTLLSRNAITAADGFVVPVVPHFLAVEGLR